MSYEINPVVGAGVSICGYSDVYACSIVEVSKSGKSIKVVRDKSVLLNGVGSGEPDALKFSPGGFCGHMSGIQRYSYEPNPEGYPESFSLRKNGRWVRKGESAKGGSKLIAGRHEHYDYNF